VTLQAPSPAEQIAALLTGTARALAERSAGVHPTDGYDYAGLISVTKEDVLAYVKSHGIPESTAWSNQPGSLDGLYMVQVGNEHHIYLQERGSKFDGGHGSRFTSKAAAESALIDYLLAMSGCDLFPLPASSRGTVHTVSNRWLLKFKSFFGRGQ
jgi:hypothetical protein